MLNVIEKGMILGAFAFGSKSRYSEYFPVSVRSGEMTPWV